MIGNSRASLAEVRQTVNGQFTSPELAQTGRDLLAVTDLLGREKSLRAAIADAGRPAAERSEVMRRLLRGKVADSAVELAALIAGLRWSNDADLVDAFEYAGAQALLGAAEQGDELDRVENELFRFGRILAADGQLQLALSSPALPAGAKRQIITDLLTGKAAPATVKLLGFIVSHLRGRRVEQAVTHLSELAAERRGQLVAVVKAAVPLTDEQRLRLAAVLERIYAQPVSLNIEIDPAVIGGITVQIGDEVIDGSLAGRLETARRRVTG